MSDHILRCTLSGSFRKDVSGLQRAYNELATCGCQILSPHRLDFESINVLFVRDSAEEMVSEIDLENHHLLAIKQSDFLWIHAGNGYVGLSTSFEIGYALAHNVPIFTSGLIEAVPLRHYIKNVPSVYAALESLSATTSKY